MMGQRCTIRAGLFTVLALVIPASAEWEWTVDASQSFLQLSIPNQPAFLPGGTPTGNLFVTNQGSNTGTWTSGHRAAISGTLSTDFDEGGSIRFRGGEQLLAASNSGSLSPDFNDWDAGTNTFNPANGTAPAVFGAQLNTTQTGNLLIVANNIIRFALREVSYDLESAVLPIVAGEFDASGITFHMDEAMLGIRGLTNMFFTIPSSLGTADDLEFSIGGLNTSLVGTVELDNDLWTLTLPISVPLSWQVFGNNFSGTAQGLIVATAPVPIPEPSTWLLLATVLAIGVGYSARRKIFGSLQFLASAAMR